MTSHFRTQSVSLGIEVVYLWKNRFRYTGYVGVFFLCVLVLASLKKIEVCIYNQEVFSCLKLTVDMCHLIGRWDEQTNL